MVVTAMEWVWCYVGSVFVRECGDKRETGHDKCRSPLFRCTRRASHFLGPPCVPVALVVIRYIGVSLAIVRYVGWASPSLLVGLFDRLGLVDGQWDGMRKEMGKTNRDFHRGSFSITHWMGLPIHGSPLSESPFPSSSENEPPTSLRKGRGGCEYFLTESAAAVTLLLREQGVRFGPHPSLEGRGS